MKLNLRTLYPILAVILLTSLTLGCNLLSNLTIPGLNQTSKGSFTDPLFGLQDLKSYQAVFRQDVIGTLDGTPYEKHTILELRRSEGQVDFARSLSGTEDPDSLFRLLTTDQVVYRWFSADLGCQGEVGAPDAGEMLDPASLLPALTGASQVGKETVNQVPTIHYTFTQAEMNIAEPKLTASGEIWVAEQGGYIVKYLLTIQPVSQPGKEELQATQEWSYELSQINALTHIDLPQDCMAVPLDLPSMPDAREVNRSSGLLSYITESTASEVIDLYVKALPALGWTTTDQIPTGEVKLPFVFTFKSGEDRLSVNIDNSDQSGLDVDLAIYRLTAPLPTQTPEVPAPPEPTAIPPTADANLAGLPADIPLYPGVTNLVKMESSIQAWSTDAVASIVAFYKQEMTAQGWSLFQEQESNGAVILIWQKDERMVSVMVTPSNGLSILVIAQQ